MDVSRPSLPTFARRSLATRSAALLLLLAACAPPPAALPPAPAPAYDATVHARVLGVADARRADAVLLDSAITASHPTVRAAAALAIGRLRARGLGPQLLAATHDADSNVARNAAFALGLLKDSAHASALGTVAYMAPLPVALEALWSLGEIGGAARPEIEQLLGDTTARPSAWRREALLAAAKLRPIPLQLVVSHLTNPDTQVVWAAAYAIARQRVPAGLRVLAGLAESPSAGVRAQVARALAKPAVGDSLSTLAREKLATLVADSEPQVRVNAVRSLATLGAADLVAKATTDSDANVRIAAAQSAVPPGNGVLPRIWFERIVTNDTSWMYRRSLMETAFRAGVRIAAATEWLSSRDWRRRAAAASSLSGARTPSALDDLEQLTRDADGRVRAAALDALASFADSGDAAPRVRTMLLVALRDTDLFARAAAMGSLAGSADASEVPLVLDSYRVAAGDRDNDARLAAIRFIAAAWRRDSADFTKGMVDAIRALPAPSDAAERRAGEGARILAHWGRAPAEARPATFYEEMATRYAASDSQPVAEIETDRGVIVVELLARDAPITVHNFVSLVRKGFYDGLRFHRVVPNFVVQDGDPRGDGNGGPGYSIRDELNPVRYERGVMGMALSGPDTGGSQYFITHSAQPHLDGHYTAFGRVVSGLEVLDAIVQGDQVRRVRIR